MMVNQNDNALLARGIRRAIGYGVISLSLAPLGALAASGSGTDPAQNLGEIQVVGSHIQRTAVEGARPVLKIDRQQIERSGLVNVGQLLQTITSTGSATNAHIDVGGNATTAIDLRNLGSERVLVLVNGKRWVTSLGGSVDLNTIPTSIVESIQILKDGATAIYGSDAIAGVINIITRKNFRGAQASAYVSEYYFDGDWDGRTERSYFTIGFGGDKGNVVVNVEHRENEAIHTTARPISAVPNFGTSNGSSSTPQGRFQFYPPAGSKIYNNATLCPPDVLGHPRCDITLKTGAPGTSISDFRPFNPATDLFNYAALYDLVAPNQSTNLYAQAHYNLTDNIQFHSTVMYNKHHNVRRFSPFPLGNFGPAAISLISKDNPYNPFDFAIKGNLTSPKPGVAQLISIGRRAIEGGFRNFTADIDTLYFNGGFNGFFLAGGTQFNWNVDYNYGHVLRGDFTPKGIFNSRRLQVALGPLSECNATEDCVPLNFFGGQYQGGSMTPAMLDYIETSQQSQTRQELHDYVANFGSGNLINLPAGGLGFNVGYEHRRVGGSNRPDTLSQENLSIAGFSAPTAGEYSVDSEYAELDVPLVANVPGIQKLGLDLASRWSDYSTFGSNNTSQAGLRWLPISDLLIRATWAEGYRAPGIGDLFSGRSRGSPFVNDPCDAKNLDHASADTLARCRADGVPPSYNQASGEIFTVNGGNPDLQPETSVSKTIGFVYSPSFLPNFNFNADFYRIEVENLISSYGAQNIVNACYIGGIAQFCDLVGRNSVGQISKFENIETNVGRILTEGLDVGVNYSFTTSVGYFKLNVQSTFTKVYDRFIPSATGGAPTVQHLAGWERGDSYTGYPRNKTNASLTWTKGNWSATYRLRYISDMREDCRGFTSFGVCSDPDPVYNGYNGHPIPTNHLGATTYTDVDATYDFMGINTRLAFGVRNLFNRKPPVSYTAHNLSFDPTLYDIPGRRFYMSLTTRF